MNKEEWAVDEVDPDIIRGMSEAASPCVDSPKSGLGDEEGGT